MSTPPAFTYNEHNLSTVHDSHDIPSRVDVTAASLTLHELQAELHLLVLHVQKLILLQSQVDLQPFSALPSTSPLNSNCKSSTPNISDPPSNAPATSIEIEGTLKEHIKHLQGFLQCRAKSIRAPQDTPLQQLSSGAPPQNCDRNDLPPRAPTSNSPQCLVDKQFESTDEKAFESLTEQFNMLVVISTFTASLIVSFLQLVKSIVLENHHIVVDTGTLLSFFAMSAHFGNIIVAGRGAALTSQHSIDDESHNLAYFYHYLEICEQLQFFATVMFLMSMAVLIFFIFSEIAFPLVLLVMFILGGLIVFWSVYWKVSMTLRNLKLIIKRVRSLPLTSYLHSPAS